jgi:hypothetical protein
MRSAPSLAVIAIIAVGCAPAGSTAARDVDDVAGGESTPGEREEDRAADASEVGVRLADDGSVSAGSLESGETAAVHRARIRREEERRQEQRDVRSLSGDDERDEASLVLTPIVAPRSEREDRADREPD